MSKEWSRVIADIDRYSDDKLIGEAESHYVWSKSSRVEWMVKWNVECISGGQLDGYILQHMTTDIFGEKNDSYEAWQVTNGIIERCVENGKICKHDDLWSFTYMNFISEEELSEYMEMLNAMVTFNSMVYWIPINTEAYKEVAAWERGCVPAARDLKSSFTMKSNVSSYSVFDRYRGWDFKKILADAISNE